MEIRMAPVVQSEPVVLADGFVFCEGPRWHAGALWFSDMHGEAVYTASSAGEVVRRVQLPGKKPSGLGFLPDGSTLIVSMTDRAVLRLARDGSVHTHAEFSSLVQDEINDMVVASDGTALSVRIRPPPMGVCWYGSRRTEGPTSPRTGSISRTAWSSRRMAGR